MSLDDELLLEVRPSPIHGTGAFALRSITRGELVGVYEGHRYPPEHVVEATADSDVTYLFGLSDGTTIDGARGGNATRHLNHSCSPNCHAVEKYGSNGELMLHIVAKRAIPAGAELFIDYELIVD